MAMTLNMGRDVAGRTTYALDLEVQEIFQITTALADSTALKVYVPAVFGNVIYHVTFSIEPGYSIWVAGNKTAVIPPAGGIVYGQELNPTARYIRYKEGAYLSIITAQPPLQIGVRFDVL